MHGQQNVKKKLYIVDW